MPTGALCWCPQRRFCFKAPLAGFEYERVDVDLLGLADSLCTLHSLRFDTPAADPAFKVHARRRVGVETELDLFIMVSIPPFGIPKNAANLPSCLHLRYARAFKGAPCTSASKWSSCQAGLSRSSGKG